MGLNWAEHSEEIEAPIETCFAAIVDYESFSRWQDAVDSTEVLDRTDDGLGHNVKLFIDAKVRKIDYVLAYRYQRPTKIEWDFVEGNGMKGMDGTYTFEELGPRRTRATYNLGADPAIPVPGMVARRVHKQLVKRSVEDLKREAERRSATDEDAAAPRINRVAPAERPRTSDADEPEGERAAPSPAADPEQTAEWQPKAVREGVGAQSTGSGPAGARGRASGSGELLDSAASKGREVAETALRVGLGVAGSLIGAGREVAGEVSRRIDRLLSGDRERD